MATTGSLYNWSRSTRQILRRNRKNAASFYLHLHPAWFRFEDAKGRVILQEPIPDDAGSSAGPSRSGQVMTPGRELLKCIRDQTLPNYALDVLDLRRIAFFDGCLIVEIKDHRPPALPTAPMSTHTSRAERRRAEEAQLNPASLAARIEGGRYGKGSASLSSKEGLEDASSIEGADKSKGGATTTPQGPETFRIVLRPNEATLWTELRNMNERLSGGTWSEEEALEVESSILTLTSAPLCLTPDLHATRIANLMMASTAPVSAYSPLQSLPHHRTLPPIEPPTTVEAEMSEGEGKGKSSEEQRETLERRQRENIMRIMEGGWKSSKENRNGRASQIGAGNSSSSAFLPNFQRLGFIERYRSNTARANGEDVAANSQESAAAEDEGPDAKKEESKATGPGTNGNTKKSSGKKRKKQEADVGGEDDEDTQKDEETTTAPKSKKKKTAAAAAVTKATSPVHEKDEQETPSKGKKSVKNVPDSDKKSKAKSKGKKATIAKDAESETAPTPAEEAPTPSVNGEMVVVTGAPSVPPKTGKKTPAAKKTPANDAKGKRSQPATVGSSAAGRQSSTPSQNQSQIPQPSPSRPGGASPFVPGTAATTPSPAISQHGVMSAPGYGNMPLGLGLPLSGPHDTSSQQHHQQQQHAAAIAAYYNGMQQANMVANGTRSTGAGLNLPFGQALPLQVGGGMTSFPVQQQQQQPQQQQQQQQQQQLNGMVRPPTMNFQLPQGGVAGGGGGNLQAAQLAQHLQQNPSLIHSLPPAVQAQLLHQLGASGGVGGQQGRSQQQNGVGGNRGPSGWPTG